MNASTMQVTYECTSGHIAAGRRGKLCWCPLALAIAAHHRLPAGSVSVDNATVRIPLGGQDRAAALPWLARKFVRRFDSGEHVGPFTFTLVWTVHGE